LISSKPVSRPCDEMLEGPDHFRFADDPPRISSSVPDAPLLFSPLTRLRGQLARGVTDFFRSLFRCQGRKVWKDPVRIQEGVSLGE
jgi:hypothetical protein